MTFGSASHNPEISGRFYKSLSLDLITSQSISVHVPTPIYCRYDLLSSSLQTPQVDSYRKVIPIKYFVQNQTAVGTTEPLSANRWSLGSANTTYLF